MRTLLLKLTWGSPGRGAVALPGLPKWRIRPAPLTVDAVIRENCISSGDLVTRSAAGQVSDNPLHNNLAGALRFILRVKPMIRAETPVPRPTHNLAVQIVRYVDDGFPGWVAAEFIDADGRCHGVVDKVPIFSTEMLDSTSAYPRAGDILCLILGQWRDGEGRELVRIITPGVESNEGLSSFVVLPGQLSDC
jgi:hypothetical protein